MFKSLLKSNAPNPDNPQADACIDPSTGSTYTLDMSHVPSDAYVQEAYLIWAGAVRTTKINDPTDNEVMLSFVSDDGRIQENQAVTGKKAYRITESEGFEFEAFRDTDNPNHSFFTYRVDVTDYFKSIHEKGRELDIGYDGFSLYGNYTLSNLECTDEETYKGSTELVSGWMIVLVYTSIEISPKKLYLYNGFKSYWHELTEINVTGFEFPTDPEVRLTLGVFEGDANLAVLENPKGGNLIPEGLQVQGDMAGWLLLSDECNPEALKTDGITNLTYTEIFNSVSSVYGWNDTKPTCIGGIPPVYNFDEMEWGMDVDTFVMDSSLDGGYAAHFNRGGQRIALKIGANQDMIITNFLMVSVDTKAPTFDIPGQEEKVACTPANDPGKWCEKGEHTFAIRVQNWGDDLTGRVTVRDTIPQNMTYVPGSTEYATEFEVKDGKKIAKKWIAVPDGGGFPLESGVKVKDTMEFCEEGSDYLSCEEFVIVRFRATVNDKTPKHAIIENVADIETPGFTAYKTNLGIPVKLANAAAGCVSRPEDIDLSLCGGDADQGCEKDEDCREFEVCDTEEGTCMPDPDIERCKDGDIEVSIGRNSPSNDIIFIQPQSDLVIGQLAIINSSEKDCYFNLNSVKMKMNINDDNIRLSNLRMVKDENNNGVVDGSEVAIAAVESVGKGVSDLAATDNASNRLWTNTANSILFLVDVAYKEGETVSMSATFTPSIEKEGVVISDEGKPSVSGLPVNFSKFQIEPEDVFIITKGIKDPPVPEKKADINGTRDILQLRAVSKGTDDKITSLKVKVPMANMAAFGSEITSIAIYEDTDNDGKGDTKIASATSMDSTQTHMFKNLNIEMKADTEKFFTIRAGLSLKDGSKMQIQVINVEVESDRNVLGTPVNSKEYEYVCD
ncbi:MAG TPA: DUF11 domain-containing protein, partial [bacterium]|nr:DUF11 domain-containing protein [bacterium]